MINCNNVIEIRVTNKMIYRCFETLNNNEIRWSLLTNVLLGIIEPKFTAPVSRYTFFLCNCTRKI